ncbi:MAG: DNA repair protein RecN [Eubacteriales bacterium]
MLKSLHIENMAVVRELELDFARGLTVLTGETGAGKSVITDSINFLVCNKINRDLIRSGETRALVGAVFGELSDKTVDELNAIGFDATDGEITLERSLTSEGRSVCRIDGRGVSQQVMRKVGSLLITIHGQHDNLRLSEEAQRLVLLDTIAKTDDELAAYRETFSAWRGVRSDIAELKKDSAEISRLQDMLRFQIKEISAAKLVPGEEEALVAERSKLQSAERIKKYTDAAAKTLYLNEKGITASSLALHAAEALSKVADVVPELYEISARLRSCTYELDDIASELQRIVAEADLTADPAKRLDEIESRLALITRLKRKYGSTVREIIEFGKNAEDELERLDSSDLRMDELCLQEAKLSEELKQRAALVTEKRNKAAAQIEREVSESLHFLDMPKTRFTVSVTERADFSESGKDDIDFLIAVNPGEPLLSLSKSASGGELSRVMLSLKCAVADADSTDTLIFDEVDTGISGKTSRKVGIKLKQASRSAQVLSVTHSAQIASLAHHHLLVSKREVNGRAETSLCELDEAGRIEETARILGGLNVSQAQRLAAIDMINEGKTY